MLYLSCTDLGEGACYAVLFLETPTQGDTLRLLGDWNDRRKDPETLVVLPDGAPPEITTLADLRHFDSLQFLQLALPAYGTEPLRDLSGIEDLEHLTVVRLLSGAAPDTLDTIGQCEQLEFFSFCGSGPSDLTPLASCTRLKRLQWMGGRMDSLEPLAGLPLQHLDLMCSEAGRALYTGLDYGPIAAMKQLVYLNVTNHEAFTAEQCVQVCKDLDDLQVLELSGTQAAAESARLYQALPQLRRISAMF